MVVVKARNSGRRLVEVTEFKCIFVRFRYSYQAIKMDAGLGTGADSWKSRAGTGVFSLAVDCGEVWATSGELASGGWVLGHVRQHLLR